MSSTPARSAGQVAAAMLAAGVAASVLAGCYVSVGVGALQHRTTSYSVAGPVRTLVVHDQVGSVHVTGSGSGTVSVTEHLSFRHSAPAVTHRLAGGVLTLDGTCPALETCSVGYDLTVPRTITVQVSDNVGAIRLESLSGQVTAHANVADINLGSVSGPLQVSGHAGSIRGQDVTSAHAILRLSTGVIDVTFSAAPATITATSIVGTVTLRVPGDVPYAVHASASVGSTHVTVSRNPASPHVITASTRTGSVTIEPAP